MSTKLEPHVFIFHRIGNSMRVTIPFRWVDEYAIGEGSKAVAIPERNGLRLKFIKSAELAGLGEEAEP
jgi:hypothetical protein